MLAKHRRMMEVEHKYGVAMGEGQIIIRQGVNVWPHELKTAQALARTGLRVEFILKSNEPYAHTADVLISGVIWEMKAPKSNKLKMVEQNLRRALRQSANVIFDSHRMKGIPDESIERELRKYAVELRRLERLIFVNRAREIVDIK